MANTTYNPEQKIPGYNWTYGDVQGGNCWGEMPAVFILHDVELRLPEGHDRYPQTEADYERYGSQLPDVIKRTVLDDIQIGCENYQALVVAGVIVEACANCPLAQ